MFISDLGHLLSSQRRRKLEPLELVPVYSGVISWDSGN